MNKTITYKIKYKDRASQGEWRETSYTSSRTMTRRELIEFFGLDQPDVYEYRISVCED